MKPRASRTRSGCLFVASLALAAGVLAPASRDRAGDLTRDAADDRDRRSLARVQSPPLGLPPVPVPESNPVSIASVRLGRKLFLDRRLSRNGTLSCAMCHVPEQGFTVNEILTAVGNEGKSLRRNSPGLLNVAYAGPFFHDGREPDLDLLPFDVFLNPDEMAAPSLGASVARVASLPGYARSRPPVWRDLARRQAQGLRRGRL